MISRSKRKKVYMKFDGRCAYCGEQNHKLCVDHIIPQRNFEAHIKNNYKVPGFLRHLTLNDVNHVDNLFPACHSCNSYKSSFDLEQFRGEIKLLMVRLNSYINQYGIVKRFNLVVETERDVVFYFETVNGAA